MKKILVLPLLAFLFACSDNENTTAENHEDDHGHNEENHSELIIPENKLKGIDLDIGKINKTSVPVFVETNGVLKVPPQNKATITAIIGANVSGISVIEGDKVKKGQVLAYLSHPDLVKIQTNFLTASHELEFLSSEYKRIKDLFAENATSEKEFQKIKSEYLAKEAEVNGLKQQLLQLNVNVTELKNGDIQNKVPILSPIEGFVNDVLIEIGEYVSPNTPLMAVINSHHLHADLLVYESDVHKIKAGQPVVFSTQNNPEKYYNATIFSVGKTFEQDPKAIHIHAEIKTEKHHDGQLIAGMYISGKIAVDSVPGFAIAKGAVLEDEGQYFALKAKKQKHGLKIEKYPLTIKEELPEYFVVAQLPASSNFVRKNAYYIISELQKDEMGDEH